MIKKLILFFTMISFSAIAQKGTVLTYKIDLKFSNATNYLELGYQKEYEEQLIIEEITPKLKLKIQVGTSESLQYIDSENLNYDKKLIEIAEIYSDMSDFYKHNLEKNQFSFHFSDKNDRIVVTDSYEVLNWEILNEQKIINGFTCYKAIGRIEENNMKGSIVKEEIFAWFSPEVSLNIGPGMYGGLPGLIFEISTTRNTYTLDSIENNVDETKFFKINGSNTKQLNYHNYIHDYLNERSKRYN